MTTNSDRMATMHTIDTGASISSAVRQTRRAINWAPLALGCWLAAPPALGAPNSSEVRCFVVRVPSQDQILRCAGELRRLLGDYRNKQSEQYDENGQPRTPHPDDRVGSALEAVVDFAPLPFTACTLAERMGSEPEAARLALEILLQEAIYTDDKDLSKNISAQAAAIAKRIIGTTPVLVVQAKGIVQIEAMRALSVLVDGKPCDGRERPRGSGPPRVSWVHEPMGEVIQDWSDDRGGCVAIDKDRLATCEGGERMHSALIAPALPDGGTCASASPRSSPPPAPGIPTRKASEDKAPTGFGTPGWVSWTAAGVGLAALGAAAAAFGVARKHDAHVSQNESAANRLCPTGACRTEEGLAAVQNGMNERSARDNALEWGVAFLGVAALDGATYAIVKWLSKPSGPSDQPQQHAGTIGVRPCMLSTIPGPCVSGSW